MAALASTELRARLYDKLARHEWRRRRWKRAGDGEALELHKALAAPRDGLGPPAGKAGLHDWLWDLVEAEGASTILDVGCGFGATLLAWARRSDAQHLRFTGLGSSAFQLERAAEQAQRLGVAARCSFVLQSFEDEVLGRFDRIVAVEALLHADDLGATLAQLAAALVDGGTLLVVEDMLDASVAADDPDVRALAEGWHTPTIWSREAWSSAAGAAGLVLEREVDLSLQVPFRAPARLAVRDRCLRLARTCAVRSSWRSICDAFLGGYALERLYARGALHYVVAKWRKPSPSR